MPEHGGQPQIGGWIEFDVTSLEVAEATGLQPMNIVHTDEPFKLKATFIGTGMLWDWFESVPGLRYQAHFYAERIGAGEDMNFELDPATDEGPLDGRDTYEILHSVPPGTLEEGLYKVGVSVNFPSMPDADPPSPGLPWAAGYHEGLFLQVIPPVP